MNNSNQIEMTLCSDMDAAIAMRDANPASEYDFYSGYENVRNEHIRFYKSYPSMGRNWFYCEADNGVYFVSEFRGQRMLHKHSLVDSISNNSLKTAFSVLHPEDETRITFLTDTGRISKSDANARKAWCKNPSHYLLPA
jgi:hypothetical protein